MRVNSKSIFWSISAVLLLLLLYWAPKAPINVDELLHNKQAKYVTNWYISFGADEACLENRPDNLRYYGQSVDNIAAFINRAFSLDNEYQTRHFMGAIMGWLLLVVTGLLVYRLAQNYVIAILAMLLLFISPRPFGQVFGNLKDIPFALGYTWAILNTVKFIKELPLPSSRTTLLLALSIAFANSVRIGGILFFFIVLLFVIIWIIANSKNYSYRLLFQKNIRSYAFITAIIIVVGYFGGLLFWPYGLQNPLVHPFRALDLMQHYSISIRQIFEGQYCWSTHLPWYYLYKWLIISIPEVVWLLLLVFLGMLYSIMKRPDVQEKLSLFVLLFCVVFPSVYVVLIKSNLYSGWRQLYFIYPGLVVIAAIGFYELWKAFRNIIFRLSFVLIVIGASFFPVRHMVKTFPNHYIYFNDLTKAQTRCWSNYEYDYYFQGMKEATDWFFDNLNVPEGSTIASNFDVSPYFPKDRNLKFKYVHFYEYQTKHWDYGIFSTNYIHPYQLKNNTWMPEGVMKTFYYDKNPYVVITKWEGDDALIGLKAFRKGLYNKAIYNFEKALKAAPNNLITMAYLARCYLIQSRFDNFDSVYNKAAEINPYNEQFLYLKAKMYYQQNKFEKALETVQHLLKLNSKYIAAFPLLANCFEKTGNTGKAMSIRKQMSNFK